MSKSVIVTGVNGEIGCSVSEVLQAHGYSVVGVDLKDADYICDFSSADHIQSVVADICRDSSAVPIGLVHCVGVYNPDSWRDVDYESFSTLMNVNVTGVFSFSSLWAQALIDQGQQGSCVVLSSISVRQGSLNPAYAASKAALEGLVKSLSRSWGADGIRINAVAPGPVESGMISALPDARRQDYMDKIPLRRFADVRDVAHMIAFLIGDEAAYITGAVMPVDGGLS